MADDNNLNKDVLAVKSTSTPDINTSKNFDTAPNDNESNNNPEVNAAVLNTSMPEIDMSKVKIRSVLKHRLKKFRPSFKKVILYIIVGLICFAAGIGVDRIIVRRQRAKFFNNRGNINRTFPNTAPFNKGSKNWQ